MPFENPPTRSPRALGEADHGERLALIGGRHGRSRQPHVQLDDLGRGEPRLVAEQLREIADPRARGGVAGGVTEQQHLARVGMHEPEQHLDHARLARTVGPEQADDLTAADGEGHPVDRGLPSVALAQARAPHRGRGWPLSERHRNPRATDSTSSSLSDPATTFTSPSCTHVDAGHRAVGRAERPSPVGPRTSAAEVISSSAGIGSGNVPPAAREASQLRRDVRRQAGQGQQVAARRLERDAVEKAVGAAARPTSSAGRPLLPGHTAATPGPTTSRNCPPSSPAGGGGSGSAGLGGGLGGLLGRELEHRARPVADLERGHARHATRAARPPAGRRARSPAPPSVRP